MRCCIVQHIVLFMCITWIDYGIRHSILLFIVIGLSRL
jgi:hypothetical protein